LASQSGIAAELAGNYAVTPAGYVSVQLHLQRTRRKFVYIDSPSDGDFAFRDVRNRLLDLETRRLLQARKVRKNLLAQHNADIQCNWLFELSNDKLLRFLRLQL